MPVTVNITCAEDEMPVSRIARADTGVQEEEVQDRTLGTVKPEGRVTKMYEGAMLDGVRVSCRLVA